MRRSRSGLLLGISLAIIASLAAHPADARRRGHRHRARAERIVPPLTPEGLPNIRSVSALAVDMDTGNIVYGKNPDAVRAIASTGKIYVALVARRRGIDLEGITEITMDDVRFARGGSRTHLSVGQRFRNHDLLRAMLIASDNRAVTAVGRAVGLGPEELVRAMNDLARDLGLQHTRFVDPTGLNGNWSSARDMAAALTAALRDPVLAEVLTTRFASIHNVSEGRVRTINYANTNHVLYRNGLHVLGGKTGYTREAGYCLVTGVEMNGRRLAFVFLGGDGELTRFADFNRLAGWMELGRGGGGAATDVALGGSAMQAQKTEDSR
ncbi:MAG TPA: serine hydrolase [Kofleriaceae bacterium]|nr:serine hydrolase [Kofleriaceae bacterium]